MSSATSLKEAAETLGVSKTTLFRKCREMGIPTGGGLSADDMDRLHGEFPAAPKVEVEMGNHAAPVNLNVQADCTSLELFRTDRTRQQLANPKEFMASLDGFLNQIETGMDMAEQQQEAELHQVRSMKRQAVTRLNQFRTRAQEYRIKSDLLAHVQNAELDELESVAEEINALGKRTDD